MFDIGMLEIGLIAVVALLVIGPERLPAVARTVGFWFGKVRKFVSSVQQDFNREVIKSEELKKLVEEQSQIKDVHEIIEKTVGESQKTVSIGADLASTSKDEEQQSDKESIKETPQLDSSKKSESNDETASVENIEQRQNQTHETEKNKT